MVNLSCGKPFSILLHIHRQKVYHTFTTPLPHKKGLPQQDLPHLYHTFTTKKVYHREGLPQQGLPQRLPQLLYVFVLPLSRKKKRFTTTFATSIIDMPKALQLVWNPYLSPPSKKKTLGLGLVHGSFEFLAQYNMYD